MAIVRALAKTAAKPKKDPKPKFKAKRTHDTDVEKSLKSRTLRVCVVGIGRIGLPTALLFAKSGLDTIGVDINENLVQNINSGIYPLKDEPGIEEIFNDCDVISLHTHVTDETRGMINQELFSNIKILKKNGMKKNLMDS